MKDVPEDELRKKGGVDKERVPLGGGGGSNDKEFGKMKSKAS